MNVLAARFALAAVIAFALVCALAQMRPDLDPVAMPLSAYLRGPYSAPVQAVYYLLAAGLVALGFVFRRSRDDDVRAAMFAVAGVALVPVAATALVDVDGANAELARLVHGLAAQTVFIVLTIAMLLQSLAWRAQGRIALAAACVAALALHRLAPGLPRGATQKLLIALILTWLAWSALAFLRCRPRSP